MSKSLIGLGIVVIVGMCLVPPMHMTVHDSIGKEGDRLFGDTTQTRTYTRTHLVYRPVWRAVPDQLATGLNVTEVGIQWPRLLLQIAGVLIVMGGLVLLGGNDVDEVVQLGP